MVVKIPEPLAVRTAHIPTLRQAYRFRNTLICGEPVSYFVGYWSWDFQRSVMIACPLAGYAWWLIPASIAGVTRMGRELNLRRWERGWRRPFHEGSARWKDSNRLPHSW